MKNFISILKIVFIGLSLLIHSKIFAQADPEGMVSTEEKSLLWEVSGKNLESPSYVFGTIHIISEKDFFMTDLIKNSLSNSEQVVMELDMDDPKTMMGMMTKIMMKDGESLQNLVSEEDYVFLKEFFQEKMGMGLAMFDKMKPFMSMAMLYPKMIDGNSASYELELMKLAKESELEILGLETVDYQLGIFDKIPYEEQANMMVEFAKGFETEKGRIDEMTQLYVNQDLEGLYNLAADSPEIGEYQDVLLDNRNINWIGQMDSMMKEKSSFFAVGAGHLWGEKGVINLLVKEGYEVKALR